MTQFPLRCLKQLTLSIFLSAFFLLTTDVFLQRDGAIGWLPREILAASNDAGTQGLEILSLTGYFLVFCCLKTKWTGSRFLTLVNSDFWLTVALLIGALVYFFAHQSEPLSHRALTFFTAAAFAKCLGAWLVSKSSRSDRCRRANGLIYLLVVLLGASALWHPDSVRLYAYRGVNRWSGAWDNPNTYGVLMGTGSVLSFGLLIPRFNDCLKRTAVGQRWHDRQYMAVSGLLTLGMMSLFRALLNSYSRGAWCATGIGLAYISGAWIERTKVNPPKWFSFNVLTLGFLFCVVGFLIFRDGEGMSASVPRRVLSVGNINDFSWRNRVDSWKGALQMIGDRPWFGFGWGEADSFYDSYYRTFKTPEGQAVAMNDYLMLGLMVGLPALFSFVAAILIRFFTDPSKLEVAHSGELYDEGKSDFGWIGTICAAGLLVLAVGFWFDGVLFKLAPAVLFFLLLELARKDGLRSRGSKGLWGPR
jgi:O-antigen ligase